MNDTLWVTIGGMFLVTYLVRASFIVFGQKMSFSPTVVQALGHVPVAVLTAIVVPEAIAPGGETSLTLTNPYLIGTLVAGGVAWKTGHLLLAVLVSFTVFGVVRFLI